MFSRYQRREISQEICAEMAISLKSSDSIEVQFTSRNA